MHPLILIGIILLAAGVGLFVYVQAQNARLEQRTESILKELNEVIPDGSGEQSPAYVGKDDLDPDSEETMPMVEIKGSSCVGRLSIPALHRAWPVGSMYGNLKEMPCHSTGTPEKGHFRIRGLHDRYRFSEVSSLTPKTEVTFTTVDGIDYRYRVVGIHEGDQWSAVKSGLVLYYRTQGGQRMMVDCSRID